eukprot:2542600-Karenia_brevis.AAC.1
MWFNDVTEKIDMVMTWHAHDFSKGHVGIFPKGAEIKGRLMLNDAHSRIKDSKIYADAIWNMLFQGKLWFSSEVGDSRPHDMVNKHEINTSLARPGGGVMFVAGSAVIGGMRMMPMHGGPFGSDICDNA